MYLKTWHSLDGKNILVGILTYNHGFHISNIFEKVIIREDERIFDESPRYTLRVCNMYIVYYTYICVRIIYVTRRKL